MRTGLTEQRKTRRLHFAQNSLTELRNNAVYIEQIIFSDKLKFLLASKVNIQNCGI